MTLKNIGRTTFELRTEDKQLSWIYHAGLNPQEFSRAARIQDIETMCISSMCDEVMRYIAQRNKEKEKRVSLAFSELCYMWSGILHVFRAQTTFLYDETMRQTHFTMEFVQRSKAIVALWQKPARPSLSKKNRSRKNEDPIDHLPDKRAKFSAEVEFDWPSIDDIEVDDEYTIQILRTSKVMNRDQISIREVIADPSPDDLLSEFNNNFEAAENGTTQNFLEIRELVAQRRSIVHTIQSECFSPMITGDLGPYDEDEHYAPMVPRQSSPRPQSPLPDIEGCYDESVIRVQDQEGNVEITVRSAWSDDISLPSLPRKLSLPNRANKGKKRRRLIDEFTQIRHEIDQNAEKLLMRCEYGISDCVKKDHIMRQLKLINFQRPAHAFRSLQPRCAKDTVPMMVGLKRVQKRKRREPDDLSMVRKFLHPSDSNRQEDVQPEKIQLDESRRQDQSRPNSRSKRSSITIDVRPQSCNEGGLSLASERCELDFGYQQEDEPMDVPDEAEPILEPEPFCDLEPITEPEHTYENVPEHKPNTPSANRSPIIDRHEQNLPSVNRSPIMDRQDSPPMVSYVSATRNVRLESDVIPRSVIRLLNQFVTVSATDELRKTTSQALLMLNNQKNRENWGLKGCLQSLFSMWYRNVHPLGMVELLHPERKKVAAALAFYSIMELNSPRIGLIVIEKVENSNAIYNITMSDKLMRLLQKRNK